MSTSQYNLHAIYHPANTEQSFSMYNDKRLYYLVHGKGNHYVYIYSPPLVIHLPFFFLVVRPSIYILSVSRMRRWSSRLRGGVQWSERAHDFLATGAHNLRLIPLVSPFLSVQLKCTPLSLSLVILGYIYLSFSFHLSIRLLFFLVFWGPPFHFFFIAVSHRDLSLSMMAVATRRAPFNCYRTDALLAFAWKHASIRRATCDGYLISTSVFIFYFSSGGCCGWPGGPAAAVACVGYFNLLPPPPILD